VCVEWDAALLGRARAAAERAGVASKIEFRQEDFFASVLESATVVTLFLWPEKNLQLRPKLAAELRAGARVVSYTHDMGEWQPDAYVKLPAALGHRFVYLWEKR
jgi:hypothetical protein